MQAGRSSDAFRDSDNLNAECRKGRGKKKRREKKGKKRKTRSAAAQVRPADGAVRRLRGRAARPRLAGGAPPLRGEVRGSSRTADSAGTADSTDTADWTCSVEQIQGLLSVKQKIGSRNKVKRGLSSSEATNVEASNPRFFLPKICSIGSGFFRKWKRAREKVHAVLAENIRRTETQAAGRGPEPPA